MYEQIVVAHVVGALITGVVGSLAVRSMWQNRFIEYRLYALVLGALATFEVVSGTTLSILSVQVSAAAVCSRVFLYLGFVAVIEALLFVRMRKVSMQFPLRTVVSPVITSVVMLVTAVAYGF